MFNLNLLKRALNNNQKIEIYYIDQKNTISRRQISVRTINDTFVTAYCCTKQATRSFLIENILACSLVKK